MNLEDQNELDLFAAELRQAHPQPGLSEDFHEGLQARLRQSWSFRSALRTNPLIRVAAGLLVMTMAAAPVAALMYLFGPTKIEKTVLGFEPRQEYSEEGWRQDAADGNVGYTIIGPEGEFESHPPQLSAMQLLELHQSSRMARVSMSWKAAQRPNAGVAQVDWVAFLAACEDGVFALSPAQRQLFAQTPPASTAADEASRSAQAAWHWVLTGELAMPAEAPLGWEGAPFIRSGQ